MAGLRRVTHRAVVRVANSEGVINSRNLVVDCRVKDPVAAAKHGLVIFERVPGEGHPGAKILLVGGQRSVLRVQFVAKTIVELEIGLDGPGILPVNRCPRSCVIGVDGIAETLLENLWESKRGRLQGAQAGKLGRQQNSGERAEHKPAREKSMRFRMIAAKQLVAPELHGVMAADEREVVRYFVSPGNREAGHKDVRSQVIRKTRNLKSDFPGFVGNDVQGGVIKLQAGFVLSRGTELMVPSGQNIVVIIMD